MATAIIETSRSFIKTFTMLRFFAGQIHQMTFEWF